MTIADEFFSRSAIVMLADRVADELATVRQCDKRWREHPDQWRLRPGVSVRAETINVLHRNGLPGDYYWPIKAALHAVDDGEPDRTIELPDGHTMTAWAIVDDLYLQRRYDLYVGEL